MKMKAGGEPASMNAASRMLMNPRLARIRPDRFTLFLIGVAVLGAGLVLARQVNHGVALFWDSTGYIITARDLSAGAGLSHGAQAPPLFPMLLATGSFGVVDPWHVAGPFNAICHGLTVLVAGQWLRRHIRSRILIVWGSLAIALSLPLIHFATVVLSEAPFILFTTLALTRFSFWLDEPRRSTLLWAAVFTALACLTRYLGIAILLTVSALLLFQRDTPPFLKVKRITGYGLISGIPLGLYLIRNYLQAGTFSTNFAERDLDRGIRTIPAMLEHSVRSIGEWIYPETELERIPHLILSLLVITPLIASFLYLSPRTFGKHLFPVFSLIYLTVLLLSIRTGATGVGWEDRFIIVVYIPCIFISVIVIDKIIQTAKWPISSFSVLRNAPRPVLGIAILILLPIWGWLGYSASIHEEKIRESNHPNNWVGHFTNSALLPYIREDHTGWTAGNIGGQGVYFYADIPFDEYHYLPQKYANLQPFIDAADTGGHIAWLHIPDIDVDYTTNDLSDIDGVDFVKQLTDGVVFRISGRTHAEKYATITSWDPDALSMYNVYLLGRDLSYIREPCLPSETLDPFFLHVTPRNIADLPEHRRRVGFDNLDFEFRIPGVIFDGKCMATIPLPDYQITSISTGQSSESGRIIWQSRIQPALDTARLQEEYDAITSATPVARSYYSLWLDGPFLSYTREPCEESDTLAHFFIHIVPRNVDDLSDERKQYGFDNLDFTFGPETGSVRFDGKCIVTRMLPEYPIDSVRTGQTGDSDLWSVDFTP